MPDQSAYHVECYSCNGLYTTVTKEGSCPHCGVAYTIMWPGECVNVPSVKDVLSEEDELDEVN